jgi:hypothetical protein
MVVTKKGGEVRICMDARMVNQVTDPDHIRTPPINELLQRFHGARYFTSLDLSSAYLQIELHSIPVRFNRVSTETSLFLLVHG